MQWLHFCDFHVGGKRGPIKEALTAQLAAIEAASEREAWKIDAVFLVGDIAYGGAAEEYQSFTSLFLEPLRALPALSSAKFFAVAGNHDVACDDTIPTNWEVIGDRKNYFFCEDADGVRARKMRAVGFENFARFTQKNGLLGPDPLKEVSTLYVFDEMPVNILTTTTAFFSDKADDSSLPATPLPLISLRERLAAAPKGKPTLIFGHHSISSFRRDHEVQLTKLLRENNAVYFHGHEHLTLAEFATKGILKSLGFGAVYIEPFAGQPDGTYKNSFTYCRLIDRLQVRAFTWESGEFVDTTAVQFSELDSARDENGNLIKVADIPLLTRQTSLQTSPTAISKVARTKAEPLQLIPVGAPNTRAWNHIFLVSENIRNLYQRGKPELKPLPGDGGKSYIALEAQDKRHLIICIPAINHILSVNEIEGINTRLDTEDFYSVTVLSLGKLSDEARKLYVRLRAKKQIEVLVNADLTEASAHILSHAQQKALGSLDAANVKVNVLLGEEDVFALIVDFSKESPSFYIIDRDGQLLDSASELVALLRKGTPEFEKMNYAGDVPAAVQRREVVFNEANYLRACRKRVQFYQVRCACDRWHSVLGPSA